MDRFHYQVMATIPDSPSAERTARAYLGWLRGGHVREVVEAGAASAEIIVLEGSPTRVCTRYVFPSREAYEAYVDRHAGRLRADGLARFGPGSDTPVEFQREVGAVVERFS